MNEINENNFEKFLNKIVEIKSNYLEAENIKWKIPLPKTNEEFKVFTKKYYGVELNCKVIIWNDGVEFEIKEEEREYSKGYLYKLWDKKFSQYDGLKVLLRALFGNLSCGGVASSHYGQTILEKSKRDLLINWDNEDNNNKKINAIKKQDNDLKEIFGGINPFKK